MSESNKKQSLSEIDGDFDTNGNRIKLLKWIGYLSQDQCVKSIAAPDQIVFEYRNNYKKLVTKRANQNFDFFEENKIYLVIEVEIKNTKMMLYFFANNDVDIAYKSTSLVNKVHSYLSSNFPADNDKNYKKDWKKTWEKVEKLKNLINNPKKPLNKALVGLFMSLL